MNSYYKDFSIGIFTEGLTEDRYARKSLDAFAAGVSNCQDNVFIEKGLEYRPCDIAIIFGDVRDTQSKQKRMRLKAEIIGRHIHKRLIIIDTPVLLRSTQNGPLYRRVGIDSLFADWGVFNNHNVSAERRNMLFKKNELKLSNLRDNKGSIIIFMQRFFDASLKGRERFRSDRYLNWLNMVLTDIRKESEREIIIRPHPESLRDSIESNLIESFRNTLKYHDVHFDTEKSPIQEALQGAFASVTFNSGSAIDSLLHGIPCVVYDPGSFAWSITPHSVEQLDDIKMPDIEQWLNELAYVDWGLDEMESGMTWQHLRNKILCYI